MSFTPAQFTTPVVNPTSSTLFNRVPYLSVSQFKAAATSIDVSALVPDAGSTAQDGALAELIAEASGWIDSHVYPVETGGVLAATVETDNGVGQVHPDGCLWLVCRFKPVIALTGLAYGSRPGSRQDIDPASAAEVEFAGKTIKVPSWLLGTGTGPSTALFNRHRLASRVYATWTYETGYPHTTLASNAAEGDTTLEVNPIVGMYPPTPLSIWDGPSYGANNEHVTVTSVTAGTPTVLNLASPLLYPHSVPVAPDTVIVTALPPTVVRAAVFLTASLIKDRGGSAMVLRDLSPPAVETEPGGPQGSSTDRAIAMELLHQFVIATGGS